MRSPTTRCSHAPIKPLLAIATELATGRTISVALVDDAMARIADPSGEGARTFRSVYTDVALAAARASDSLREHGMVASPLAGIPVSIRDLFDVAGDVTRAGSTVLADAAPAAADAIVVRRLREAGAIVIGRTNTVEFAFSGLGINPHYGTPRNPWDRVTARIPGGSSSGAAVSVSDGMAAAGLGTDTGGSVRIPAALCGLTGFKPTTRRIAKLGTFPLSTTLDSIGPIAASVACCAVVDSILAGLPVEVPAALPHINRNGGLVWPEAAAIHCGLIRQKQAGYDPRVASRIQRGREVLAADYIATQQERAAMIAESVRIAVPFDALLMPTVEMVAPAIAPLEVDEQLFNRIDYEILRNPSVVNFIDGCALSVPCHPPGSGPVGLMIVGHAGEDRRLFAIGLVVEAALRAA